MTEFEYSNNLRPETLELLFQLEERILELGIEDEYPQVDSVFRILHTIKGECALLGFKDIAEFAHRLEEIFDLIRKKQMQWSNDLARMILIAQDHLNLMISAKNDGSSVDPNITSQIIATLYQNQTSQTSVRQREVHDQVSALIELLQTELASITPQKPLVPTFKITNSFAQLHANASILGTDLGMFIEKFATAYANLAESGMVIPHELITLTSDALAWFPVMLADCNADLSQLDPLTLIESMQKPIEFHRALSLIVAVEEPTSSALASSDEDLPAIPDLSSLKKTAKQWCEKSNFSGNCQTFRLLFSPLPKFSETGAQLNDLVNELNSHGLTTVLQLVEPEEATEQNPSILEVIFTTTSGLHTIQEVFEFIPGIGKLNHQTIDHGYSPESAHLKIGEILRQRGDITSDQLEQALELQSNLHNKQEIKTSSLRKHSQKSGTSNHFKFVRVPLERITELVNLIGKLSSLNSELFAKSLNSGNPELVSACEEQAKVIEKLNNGAMLNRMKPVRELFVPFVEMGNKLALELGKEVRIEIEGGETELDLASQDKLHDPLIHLLRNTIDHGIEPPEARIASGKKQQGLIKFSSFQTGTSIKIVISDDGAGINTEKVLAKAIERGFIAPQSKPSQKEIFSCIFLPGFSTNTTVTELSGRGTGMDVVKRMIDSLQGTISIDSEPGQGTKFTLTLPLNGAILGGLLVEIKKRNFVIPLTMVVEVLGYKKFYKKDFSTHFLDYRGRVIPYYSLAELLGLPLSETESLAQVIICSIDDRIVGFLADKVLCKQQSVVKSMGKTIDQSKIFSGLTILGDGDIALILDLPKLLQNSLNQYPKPFSNA